MIENSQQIIQELSTNWPILAEIGKHAPTILLLETVIAHIKGKILATVKPQDSSRIVDDSQGRHISIESGENNAVLTWFCPNHQSSHTVLIEHQLPDLAKITAAGGRLGDLTPASKSIAISPDVTIELVQ